MTPFAQLEKSASMQLWTRLLQGLPRLNSRISRAFKGFRKAPTDIASFATGRGMPAVAKELGRAGQLGNLAGHAAIATGTLMGAGPLMGAYKRLSGGSKDSEKPNRERPFFENQHPLDLRMLEGKTAGSDAASKGLSKDQAIAEFLEKYRDLGGSRQSGAMPKGMRFDAKPRDWDRMGGTGGMLGRDPLQAYQRDLLNNIKSSPFVAAVPALDSMPS